MDSLLIVYIGILAIVVVLWGGSLMLGKHRK